MRIPRKLSTRSGQGIARIGYQSARSLGAKGTGAPGFRPLRNIPGVSVGAPSTPRTYSKDSTPKKLFDAISNKGYGVYDDTAMANPDLAALKKFPNA